MSDKHLDKVAKKVQDLREEISKAQVEFPGAIGPVLGELARALDLFEGRKNVYPELFSDAKPRPSREERHIRSAETNLQKQKDLLADMKKRKAFYLSHPGVSEVIPVEAIERQTERVEQAERQLARVRGEHQAYHAEQKEKRTAARKEEVAEYERGVTGWQNSWRSGEWINPNWQPKKD